MFIIDEKDYISHEGVSKRDGAEIGSGRYRLGSGDNPYQHEIGFRDQVKSMKNAGMSEKEIADYYKMSISQLRSSITISKEKQTALNVAQAHKYKDHGYSNTEIAKLMNTTESNIRNWLKKSEDDFKHTTANVADVLRDEIKEKKYLDVGLGTEQWIGVSREKLKAAIDVLESEGYERHKPYIEQVGTGKSTKMDVLCEPGTTFGDLMKNKDQIAAIGDHYTEDGGRTILGIEPPRSIDSSRVQIVYAEDGGKDKDGLMEIRRGVDELNMGSAQYAQVRIAVDGTHYLKGMAVYSDDLPKGIDIRFNTNKTKDIPKMEVLKEMKKDEFENIMEDNPFGATIKQHHYIDKNGEEQLSAINIVNQEGKWSDWSRNLPSQFLSKQSPDLAKKQLDLNYQLKKEEFDEICSLTNPAVKKKLLESLSDDLDAEAVHLKAAALPRQATKVLIPLTDISDKEIYAPGFNQGEKVVLVRFPHGGIFELPELTVNNKVKSAKSIIPNAVDAVGISSKVAEQLSGADFDGDTVLVIPNNDGKIKTKSKLMELKNFDPSNSYPAYPGMKKVKDDPSFNKQMEMGKVSNLITDMTIMGASDSEIARAVRHSMVVIDAEKHNLDWRTSEKDNDISSLKEKYQGGKNRGAATLISRSTSEADVPERKEIYALSKMTPEQVKDYQEGKKIYVETGRTSRKKLVDTDKLTKDQIKDLNEGKKVYIESGSKKKLVDPNKLTSEQMDLINAGKKVYVDTNKPKTIKSTKGYEYDPYSLTSGGSKENPGTKIEAVYAKYASDMKALANTARKEMRNTGNQVYSSSANKTYEKEVNSLNAKLSLALKNKPLERQAQSIAGAVVREAKRANPDMDNDQEKKIRTQAINEARSRMGTTAKKERDIPITQNEWNAIQAGAITQNKLKQILDNTDLDKVREYATPRTKRGMSSSKVTRAKSMLKQGYTQSEVARLLGVSVSTLDRNIHPELYKEK